MKVAYCSLLLPEEKHLAERSKKRLSGISLHKFTSALINGIDANLDEPLTVFNIINTLNYPNFPDIVFKTEQWHHNKGCTDWHIGYVNLFGIKYITQEIQLYKKLRAWVLVNINHDCIICVHHIYYPAMKAALAIKQEFSNVKICLITGDMNGNYGLQSQYRKNIKYLLTKQLERKIDFLATQFDCFVFATKDMAEAFKVKSKPFVVVECAYLPSPHIDNSLRKNETDDKIIFYAGAIRNEYGIPHLLRAFHMINQKNYYLQLAGDGNAVPLVKEYIRKNTNIQFLGFISPQEVERRQQLATITVSPRTSEFNFVKYSFPSKSLDCLASGIPYVAHRLPCDPPEYADFIQYADDETDEALKNKIVEICELSLKEREVIGVRAKHFILEQKNPVIMARKIVDLWQNVFKGH